MSRLDRLALAAGGCAVALLVAGSLASSASGAVEKGTVTGTVTGIGLDESDLSVTLNNGNNSYQTDVEDGVFSVKAKPGHYTVALAFDNGDDIYLYDEAVDVHVTSGATTTQDVGYSLVSGTVMLDGAAPTANQAWSLSVSTFAPGDEWSPNTGSVQPGGGYQVIVASDGTSTQRQLLAESYKSTWASEWYDGVGTRADATLVTFTPGTNKTIDFDLDKSATIQGSVKLPKGAGYVERTVMVFDEDGNQVGWADANRTGKYAVKGLASGSYFLSFARSSGPSLVAGAYYAGVSEADVASALPVDVSAGGLASLNPVTLSRGATITGTVVDKKGKARPKLRVVAVPTAETNSTRSANTNKKGVVKVTGLTTGSYRVYVWNTHFPRSGKCVAKKVKTVTVTGTKTLKLGKIEFKPKTSKTC